MSTPSNKNTGDKSDGTASARDKNGSSKNHTKWSVVIEEAADKNKFKHESEISEEEKDEVNYKEFLQQRKLKQIKQKHNNGAGGNYRMQ